MPPRRPPPFTVLRFAAYLLLALPATAQDSATAPPAPAPNSAPSPDAQAGERVALATFLDDRPTVVDPTAHYTLYLPASYRPEKLQPVLLIFDPRGRARMAAELFHQAADRYGWILISSNDTRSDTTWEPNMKAVNALGPELQRFAVDPRRVYATGFSGGAILAWWLGQRTKGLAGVISVGGRLGDISPDDPPFVHWGAAGDVDFNYDETKRMDDLVARQGIPHWVEIFSGPHTWFSPELATQAVGWMELQAMRRDLREKDPTIVETLWAEWSSAGAELEAKGELLAAQRRFQQLADSFAGLRDVGEARAAADRLDADKRVEKARRDERKWDGLDDRFARVTLPQLFRAGADQEPLTADELREVLDLRRLQKQAQGDGYAAIAANRMLGRVMVQAAFYLPRDYMAAGNYRAAKTVLTVALQIDDANPGVWYALACSKARLGDAKGALEALAGALDHGYRDAAAIRADEDLASLRGSAAFEALLGGLGGP